MNVLDMTESSTQAELPSAGKTWGLPSLRGVVRRLDLRPWEAASYAALLADRAVDASVGPRLACHAPRRESSRAVLLESVQGGRLSAQPDDARPVPVRGERGHVLRIRRQRRDRPTAVRGNGRRAYIDAAAAEVEARPPRGAVCLGASDGVPDDSLLQPVCQERHSDGGLGIGPRDLHVAILRRRPQTLPLRGRRAAGARLRHQGVLLSCRRDAWTVVVPTCRPAVRDSGIRVSRYTGSLASGCLGPCPEGPLGSAPGKGIGSSFPVAPGCLHGVSDYDYAASVVGLLGFSPGQRPVRLDEPRSRRAGGQLQHRRALWAAPTRSRS